MFMNCSRMLSRSSSRRTTSKREMLGEQSWQRVLPSEMTIQKLPGDLQRAQTLLGLLRIVAGVNVTPTRLRRSSASGGKLIRPA